MSPIPAAQGFAFGRGRPRFLEPVPLDAEPVNRIEHSIEQGLGRGGGDSGPLELPDLPALPINLCAHTIDFCSNMFDVRHGPKPGKARVYKRTKREQIASR
jgi:hypothetical protein